MSSNNEDESPVRVEDIVNEFKASTDEDIKYMILKKPIHWNVIEDLTTYYENIIKPVFKEGSPDVTNLLSSEMLPHIFEDDIEPFINTLLEPLLSLFGSLVQEERKSLILQCFKAVLGKFISKSQNSGAFVKLHKDFISQYIHVLKTSGYDVTHKVLYRDILRLLIQISYQHVIPIDLMSEILQTTSTETKFDPTTRQLLDSSFKLVNYKELHEINEMITLSQLVVLSERWYKFNEAPFIYYKFVKQNAEDLKIKSVEEVCDEVSDILHVLVNFKPLFFTTSYSSKKVVDAGLGPDMPLYFQNVLDYLQHAQSNYNDHMRVDTNDLSAGGEFVDEDIAQQDYLNELQSDTDNFEEEEDPFTFEDGLSSAVDKNNQNANNQISILISRINELHKEHKLYKKATNQVLDTPDEIDRVINTLNTSSDYDELHHAIDLVENIVKDPIFEKIGEEKQLELYTGLLLRLKRDKEFVKVLKVGNMKQKIDEGLDIRITIYSILLQTKETMFTYTLACMILETIATLGVKEKDPSIFSQIVTLYKKIMTQYETYLEGVDPEWFETHIVRVIMDQNPDLYHSILQH
ncbi:cullin-associated NEDD8-dissociated protein 1 homolog [Monosporozyma unispora]|nr:hypothetical protein C6P44_001187 [Kazachstania unispora]